jgi:serine/threonine-protein kinase PpkA
VAFTVRALLSKNQLSDLQKTLQVTVEALEKGQIDPSDLFNQIRSASVAIGRDPSRVGQGNVKNLEATGLMGEYLDGLPYQSQLMGLTEDDWVRMGVGEQQAIIDGVYSKIQLYQRFHDDARRWIALNEGDDPGDWVYPVPLDVLP